MSSGSPETYEERSFLRRIAPKLVLSLALGALFAWLVSSSGVPLNPGAMDFSVVAWWTVPAYTASLLVTHTLRATRWRFLIAPIKKLPIREVIALNWIGFFAIFVLPLRIGEVARPVLTKVRHHVGVSVGFGTIAVERVVDGLVTSLCVAWALFALPRLDTDDELAKLVPYYGYVALTIFACAFLALAVFLWQRDWAVRATEAVFGLFSKRLGKLVAEKVDGVADGIRSLASFRLSAGFLFETALYWGSNAAGMWLLAYGCGIPMSFGQAVAIMGILAIGILLPTGPGLFGPFQLAISAGLKMFFAAPLVETNGAVYIFLMYVVQSVVIVVSGVIPLYRLNLRMQDLLGADALREGLRFEKKPDEPNKTTST